MDGAPTLNEITSIHGDANIAGGTAGEGAGLPSPAPVQYDEGLQFLNQASLARAQYNKYLQDQYQTNLADNLKNLRDIDFSKVLPEDLPAMRQKYADLAQAYGDNFSTVRNPASNPQQWAQFGEQEADLRGDIQQSAVHNTQYTTAKDMLAKNPSWATPANLAAMQNYASTPANQRGHLILQPPNDVDMGAMIKAGWETAKQTGETDVPTADGHLVKKQTIDYNPDKAVNSVINGLKNTYSHGVSNYDLGYNNFKLMTDKPLNPDGSPQTYDQWLKNATLSQQPNSASAQTMTGDPIAEEKMRERFEAQQQATRLAAESDQEDKNRALQIQFQKKGTIDPQAAGEAALRTIAIANSTGNIPTVTGQTLLADNSLITKVVKIPNAAKPGDDKLATTSTVKMPAQTYLYSKRDADGNFRAFLRDNKTGQLVEKETSYPELLNNLSSQYGPTFAPQIAGAISSFSQNKFGKPIPTESDLQGYYKLPGAKLSPATNLSQNPNLSGTVQTNTAPVVTNPNNLPVIQNNDDITKLAPGSKFIGPDGKTYQKN